MPDEGDEEMLTRNLIDKAEAERDGARRITAEALKIMTDDQRQRLRDRLVCLQMEEELWLL